MIVIKIGDDNLLNTSYQAGWATLDVSKYLSNNSIAIKMYGINKCGVISNHYKKETVRIGQGMLQI